MTLKNAVTKGVKAWRDRRVGYWLCIDPKTGEYYLHTSMAEAEVNGLRAMYRLVATYYRVVLTRDWNVKLGPHVIGTHLDTTAYIKDLDGFFSACCVDVEYTQSQEYFADFAENNEFEFYENGICIRHR